jgi:hypothetical protein
MEFRDEVPWEAVSFVSLCVLLEYCALLELDMMLPQWLNGQKLISLQYS